MTVKAANFEESFQISEDGSDYQLDLLEQMADDDVDFEQDAEEPTFIMDEMELGDLLPGAPIAIFELDGPEDEVKETDWENDGDHSKFMDWLRNQLTNLPQHSGQTTVGCERVIAALNRLNRELSRAISSDLDCLINEDEAEKMRDTIEDWKDKLEDALEKLKGKKVRKKKSSFRIGKEVVARMNDGQDIQYFIAIGSDEEETLLQVRLVEPTDEQVAAFIQNESLTKEAGAGITLVEDPFLHSITRLLISSHITNGKDMEKVYAHFKDKYDLTPREELSIHELLHQKGFPLIKDLGRVGEETVNRSEGNGIEHDTEYFA